MKTFFLTALILIMIYPASAQKIIDNPEYGLCSQPKVVINRIEINDTATILSFRLYLPKGASFGIGANTFIRIVGRPDSLVLTKKEIPIDQNPGGMYTAPEGGLSYKLFFPPIDPSVNKIDYIEPYSNPWNIFDIEITEQPHKSVIPFELLGNWFSADKGDWTFSFFDSLAIYESRTWEYSSVNPRDNIIEIRIENGDDEQTLYCRYDGREYCYMRAEKEPELRFSKNADLLKKMSGEGDFEIPLLDPGKVVYRGYLKGYSKRLGITSGMIQITNRLNNQRESHAFKIEDNGSFSVEFPLAFPQEVSVGLPYTGTRLFFEPGKTIFHLANAGLDDYPALFMGESASVNYGLKATENIAVSNMDFVKEIGDMTDIEYIEHVINTRNVEEQKLGQTKKERNLDNKTLQIRNLDILFREAANAVSFNQNRRRAVFYRRMEAGNIKPPPFEFAPFDINLLKKIKDIPVNSELALVSSEYINLINALKLNDFARPQGSFYYILTELADELKDKGIELTGEEKDMIEFVRINLCDNYNDEHAGNLYKSYGEVLNNFNQTHVEDFINISNKFYLDNLTKNLNIIFGNSGGLPVEITETQNYLSKLKNETGSPDEEAFKRIKQSIRTDYVKEYVISEFYKKRAENEIKNLPETSSLKTEGDKIFDSIIRKYLGKVVYVDFWATWCAPCLAGIEKIKPLKDEMENEDVVFLYITDPSSPEADYNKRIPGIKGEHVRLTNDEWIHLKAKFNIYGIPHYALVDKNGRIVNAHLMPMGNDKLKQLIQEQIMK